jgi:hypothetical protein
VLTTGATGIGTGTAITMNFKVPIVGWSSTVQLSDQADGRAVVASAYTASGSQTATSTFQTVTTLTPVIDTHGGFNGSGVYTVPVSGQYFISAAPSLGVAGGYTCGVQIVTTSESLTGPLQSQGSGGECSGVSGVFNLIAGNTVTFKVYQNSGGSALYGVLATNKYSITRIGGTAAIGTSETVVASYAGSATTSLTTNTTSTLTYSTSFKDSHSAMNAATGIFTAPVAGTYQVCANYNVVGSVANALADIFISINSVTNQMRVDSPTAGSIVSPTLCMISPMTAGSTAFAQARCTFGSGTCQLNNALGGNFIQVLRVGN